MKENLEQLKNQKHPRQVLDLKVINKLPVKRFYILDASAVLNDSEIEKYSKNYPDIKDNSCFIITTIFLKEIDDFRHKKPEKKEVYSFMDRLLKISEKQKLSEGVSINDVKDYIYYYPYSLLCEWDKYDSLSDDYTDKQLLCFAKKLLGEKKDASIITSDILLQILCREEGISYVYIPPKIISEDTTKTLPVKPVISVGDRNSQDYKNLNMKKRVLILHGWESNSKEHWFLEEKQRLEKLGYEVVVPDMPNTFHPKKEEWIKVIEDFAPDDNSILIGHSLGGVTILRYLERIDKRLPKCILIATPIRKLTKEGYDFEPINHFFESDFNWEKIKQNCQEFIVINQTKDNWIPLQHGKDLASYLGGKLEVVEGDNHFDTIDFSLLEKFILI